MNKSRFALPLIFCAGLVFFCWSTSYGLPPPESGLQAEVEGNWQEALDVYHQILAVFPNHPDLWIRVADIEARLGHRLEAAQALEEATRLTGEDAPLQFRLSQAWSMAGRPDLALEAIEKALYLDPRNQEYQKARTILASWLGDNAKAASSMEMMAKLNPTDEMSELNKARALSLRNDLDESARTYESYHRSHKPDRQSLLEQARVEAWRGNYAKAMELQDSYRKKFGEDQDYLRDRARLLAWADLPDQAMVLVNQLLQGDPDDFHARFTKAIALRNGNSPSAALDLAEGLRREQPSRDTEDLYLMAWTPVRHHLDATFSYYSDADNIEHFHSELFGAYFISPVTSLGVRLDYDYLTANAGSGLENIDGSESEQHRREVLEAWHRYAPWLAANIALGASQTGELDSFTGRVDLMLSPADTLDLRLTGDHDYYLVSPRAISADIRSTSYLAEAIWRPGLKYTVLGQAGFQDFSDDNSKWLAILAPRRSFLRSQYFNLDLGLRGWLFGFDRDLNNGYCDPKNYQSYMATAFGYWKINRDNGVGLTLAAGLIKDDSMSGFEFGWDTTLEGYFGIYRNWMLKAFTSIMQNQRQGSGAYDANNTGLTLIRRF
jgi:tetratricopeptide (TPR) repeat protein